MSSTTGGAPRDFGKPEVFLAEFEEVLQWLAALSTAEAEPEVTPPAPRPPRPDDEAAPAGQARRSNAAQEHAAARALLYQARALAQQWEAAGHVRPLTGPSRKPDPEAKPTGVRAAAHPNDKDPDKIRSARRENEAADILARAGYRVDQIPEGKKGKNPDYLLEGDIFDCYAPKTDKVSSIYRGIKEKVVGEQARRIVLYIDDSSVSLEAVAKELGLRPLDKLEQILVIREGEIVPFWP